MTGTIVLIEDNAAHRKVYSAMLRAHGYDPVEIADERTALPIIRAAGARAIIVDILLPHVDGRRVIGQIREEDSTRTTPIIAVSAVADEEMASSCLAAGATRFRAKPIPLSLLAADIVALTAPSPPAG